MNDVRLQLQAFLDGFVARKGQLRVLEAGCGSATHIDLGSKVYSIGIDIEPGQLDRNEQLDEKILGDIQTHELPDQAFDVIVCWDVLEHLPHPEKALASFRKAVKPDGLIIIAVPNLYSIKGLVTRFTPHWFHVLVYRYVYGNKNAGKKGYGPFRTYMRRSITPNALRQSFTAEGLVEEFFRLYPTTMITGLKQRSPIAYGLYVIALYASKVVTLWQFDGNNSDMIGVFRKPAES